jgi:GT2 family glycosyltransferase
MNEAQVTDNFFRELMVVLVIYEMDIGESPAFRSLTDALQAVNRKTSILMYDNSRYPHTHSNTLYENWVVTYRNDPSNPGVSKAYNEGFKHAKEQAKKWMLLSDQDTRFPATFFESVRTSMTNHPGDELFAPIIKGDSKLISPFRFKLGKGFALQSIEVQCYSLNDLKFINSGLLISTTLFEKCNGYDERFPLDFSDLAFIQRLKKYKDRFVVVKAICSHSLSSDERIFSKSVNRFTHFVNASRMYGRIYNQPFIFFASRLFRAIKLSFRFRSLGFIKSLFNLSSS